MTPRPTPTGKPRSDRRRSGKASSGMASSGVAASGVAASGVAASGEVADGGSAPVGEVVVRVAGGVLVAWLAVLTAVVEAYLAPLRVGGVHVPLSLGLAVVANVGLPYLALWLVRHRVAAMLPALLWFVVILIFAGGTTEGDVVLAGNDWVALTLLLLGSAAAAAGVYFALLRTAPSSAGRFRAG